MASALLLLAIAVLSSTPIGNAQNIGVCYGMMGDNLPSTQEVVNLYKSNEITKMRIYSPQKDVLQALQGSAITLMLGVPNDDIVKLGSSALAANQWVQNFVVPYASVVKYIAVGNGITLDGEDPNAQYLLMAMQNVQNALASANLDSRIKVSTVVNTAVLVNTFPPSNSVFTADNITSIVKFLKSNGSPLLAKIYPYFVYVSNTASISLDYALFTAVGTVVIDSGNGLSYQNLFDALVDSFYAALENSGGDGVEIVVAETGWPSRGSQAATPLNAATYYANLIGHVAGGTPRNGGKPVETYLFAMFDENLKPGGEAENHFGLFTPDEQNKYWISYSGKPTFLGSLCYE